MPRGNDSVQDGCLAADRASLVKSLRLVEDKEVPFGDVFKNLEAVREAGHRLGFGC